MVETAQRDLARRLQIKLGDQEVPVSKVVYEAAAIEGLVNADDQVALRHWVHATPESRAGKRRSVA